MMMSTTFAKKRFELTTADLTAIQGYRRKAHWGGGNNLTMYYSKDLEAASIKKWGQAYFDSHVPEGREKSGVAGKEREEKEKKKAAQEQIAADNQPYSVVPLERLGNLGFGRLQQILLRYDVAVLTALSTLHFHSHFHPRHLVLRCGFPIVNSVYRAKLTARLPRCEGGVEGPYGRLSLKEKVGSKKECVERITRAGYTVEQRARHPAPRALAVGPTLSMTDVALWARVSHSQSRAQVEEEQMAMDDERAARDAAIAKRNALHAAEKELAERRAATAKRNSDARAALYAAGELDISDLGAVELRAELRKLGEPCHGSKVDMQVEFGPLPFSEIATESLSESVME
jgi:hypothetical protein